MFKTAMTSRDQLQSTGVFTLLLLVATFSTAIILSLVAMTSFATAAPSDAAQLALMLAAPDLEADVAGRSFDFAIMTAALAIMAFGSVMFGRKLRNDLTTSDSRNFIE